MRPVVRLVITAHEDGALSVEGPVDDVAFCLAMLDNARDAVRNRAKSKVEIVTPAKDVTL